MLDLRFSNDFLGFYIQGAPDILANYTLHLLPFYLNNLRGNFR